VAGSLRVLANASKEFQPHAMPNRSMTARLHSEKWIAQPVLYGLLKPSFVSDTCYDLGENSAGIVPVGWPRDPA
jgi:hypothetical protein